MSNGFLNFLISAPLLNVQKTSNLTNKKPHPQECMFYKFDQESFICSNASQASFPSKVISRLFLNFRIVGIEKCMLEGFWVNTRVCFAQLC